MNMKKMRGAVDPYTLGFILAALISAVGITGVAEKQENAEAQAKHAAYVKQDTIWQTHPQGQQARGHSSRQ